MTRLIGGDWLLECLGVQSVKEFKRKGCSFKCWGYTAYSSTSDTKSMTAAPKKESAFTKALKPSVELAAIVGAAPLPRTEVIKKLWEYIKANNLQNPANKRNILCDAKLKAVLGKPEVTMFELTGLAGKHLA